MRSFIATLIAIGATAIRLQNTTVPPTQGGGGEAFLPGGVPPTIMGGDNEAVFTGSGGVCPPGTPAEVIC